MKILMGFLLIAFSAAHLNAMTLLQAIQHDDIYVEIKKVDDQNNFMFPNKNLLVAVMNKTNNKIELEINPGYLLESNELSSSMWVTIDKKKLTVSPDIITEIGVKGMSLQKLLNEPSNNSYFQCSSLASSHIVAVCEYIYKHDFNNSIGQDALWAINKDQAIHSIDGPSEITIPIKHYVATLLNVDLYDQPGSKNIIYVTDKRANQRLLFEFEIHAFDNIRIDVVEANELNKKNLLDRKYQQRFNHSIYYNLPLQGKEGQKLYVRAYQNDEILEEYIIVVEKPSTAIMAETRVTY